MSSYKSLDIDDYIRRIQDGPCFICEMLAGNPDYHHHIIYQDDSAVVFLNKYPTLYGYTLVAPRPHREQVTADFTMEEYVALQQLVYRVGEAIRQTVATERLYVLSLGSQQGNRHVHWHIAPLPPDVPLEKQQCEAIRLENGVLDLSQKEMSALALRVRQKLETLHAAYREGK